MAFEQLGAKQQEIVLRCLKAVDRFIGDDEKHSRLGVDAAQLRAVIHEWPTIDDSKEDGNGFLAINNCLNEVCNGFRIEEADWSELFDAPMSEVQSAYDRWLELKDMRGGIR